MNEIILFIGVIIGSCTVTSYRSVRSQTDSSPNFTSIGDKTHHGGVAVSRDLLKRWGGLVNYGDYVYIEGMGIYQVNDCMGATSYDKVHHKRVPIKHHFDVWVASYEEEKKVGVQNHNVYLITRKIK